MPSFLTPHFQSIPDPSLWARYFKKLQHIMPEGQLPPFDSLSAMFNLTLWMFFRYLRLGHATQSQFPTEVTVTPAVVEHFLISSNADQIISSLYLRISSRDTGRVPVCFMSGKKTYPTLLLRIGKKGFSNIFPW